MSLRAQEAKPAVALAPAPTAAIAKQPPPQQPKPQIGVTPEDSQLDDVNIKGKHMLRIKRNRRVIRTGPVASSMGGLPDLRIPGYGYTAPVVPYNGSPTQAHTVQAPLTTLPQSTYALAYQQPSSPYHQQQLLQQQQLLYQPTNTSSYTQPSVKTLLSA